MPVVSFLESTTVLDTKIKVVDNKIPDLSGLVKKTDYGSEISEIEGKFIIISDYDKFTNDILDAKVKQRNLVNKSSISNLAKKI